MPSGQEGTMPGLTVSGSPRVGAMVWQSFTAMTPAERTRVTAMYGAIAGLHLLGFFILFVFVVPSHYKGLGIGVATLAYTLGLRHAFDADHISAVDNTTRKVLGERQGTGKPRPFGFGFFFSLGHSSVVVAIGAAIIVAERTVFPAVSNSGSPSSVSGLRLGLLQLGPQGVLQPRHHRAVRGHLLVHRWHRGSQPALPPDRRAQPQPRLVGIPVQLQPQHGRLRDRAMFIVTWLAAMLIWRYGQIEEKWTARLQPGTPCGTVREPPAAEGGEPLVIYSVHNKPGGA
jgi:hypothetical protein